MNKFKRIFITVFFGWFGLHKYLDGKVGMGILYTFTFGLFSIGWFFDIVKLIMPSFSSNTKSVTVQNFTKPTVITPKLQTSNRFGTNYFSNVHPDLKNLLWFGDGPYKNYINDKKHSSMNTIFIDGFTLHVSTYGNEEPSLIYEQLPVSKPYNIQNVPRPPYYPSYKELTAEQRWMYLKFLENPYTGTHDIGYVFIFYYGLERYLFSSDSVDAFKTILKLRDTYSNKSFQSYSGTAIILYAIYKKDISLARDFLESLDKRYEMEVPSTLFILLKYCLNIPLTAFEIMQYAKAFLFNNQRYIKNNPEIFLGFLQEEIKTKYASDFLPIAELLSNANASNIKLVEIPLFANISIIDKIIRIPDFLSYSPFVSEVNALLMCAHEKTKGYLATQRKKNFKENTSTQLSK